MFNVYKFEKLNSTNKFALENIEKYPENSVIQADIQEAGRGRFDRKWISDIKNNCYISFILKPDNKYNKVFQNITQYLSVVLAHELKRYGVKPAIKWPNDLLVNGKKIAGILSEAVASDNMIKAIVLGVGVNLNLTEEDISKINIPATSLNLETSQKIDSSKFIDDLIRSFFEKYQSFLENGFLQIRNDYKDYCNFIGKEIIIKNPAPTCLGVASDICDDGAMEIISSDGEKCIIYSGDVVL